jgi:hypothetical protein
MTLLDANENQGSHSDVGEDTWELFEAIEESFAVDLGDYYGLAGISVGELSEKICMLANYPAEDRCLSSAAFYRLRRAFDSLFGVPRSGIRPSTLVRELLPWKSRKSQWRSLEEHLGLNLPKLMFPSWLLLLCLVASIALPVSVREFLGLKINWFALFLGSALLFFWMVVACVPLARTLLPSYGTMGGLAKVVLARNYATFAAQNGSSPERGVLSALRLLIAVNVGIEPEEISTETRIPSDLNIY